MALRALCLAILMVAILSPSSHAADVGSSAGTLAVTPGGAATYSIPITVPPGVRGLQPQLALAYSSHAPNGLLGVGFALTGLSQITRCPAALEPDGFIDPVDFDDKDRFCLDGQRLLVAGGTYGAVGAEYRTEIATFSKIVAIGGTANDPASFRVWTRDGIVMDFGATADSRWVKYPQGGAGLIWALSRIEDRSGNDLTVRYSSATGEMLPTSVSYGGNATGGTAHALRVEFLYEDRPDPSLRYLGGSTVNQWKRLVGVRTHLDDSATLVRDYRIAYAGGPGPSRVASITECAGTVCLPPTTFTWQGTGSGWTATSFAALNTSGDAANWLVDVNGDGLADYVTKDFDGVIYWNLSTGSGWGPNRSQSGLHHVGSAGGWFVDINGDGKADYVTKNHDDTIHWNLSTGDGWGPNQYQSGLHRVGDAGTWLVDVNGDGLTDYVTKNRDGNLHWNLATGTGWGPNQTQGGLHHVGDAGAWLVDVNGDGMADYVTKNKDGTIHWNLSTGTGWSASRSQSGLHGVGSAGVWFADLNGDGMADYVTKNHDDTLHWNLSTGDGWQNSRSQAGLHGAGAAGAWLVDISGDGMADYVTKNHDGLMHWNLFTGDGWGPSQVQDSQSGPGSAATWIADVSGDGIADFVAKNADTTMAWTRSAYGTPLLAQIVDGLGAVAQLDYRPLWDTTVHTRSSGAAYPVDDVQGVVPVVAALRTSDGLGGLRQQTYRYAGARAHLRGRGWLGFAQFTVEDGAAGVREITTFRQDFPFVGVATYQKSETTAGFMFADTSTTLVSRAIGPATFGFAEKIVSRTYELNTQQRTTTTIVDSVFDDYGNLTSRYDRAYAGASTGGSPFETTVTNQYAPPDLANWRIAQLTRSSVNRDAPDLASITRTSAFEYDPGTGLLSAEVVEPDDPLLRVRTSYTRDALGNVVTQTTSGDNFATRSNSWEFDRTAPYFGRFATRTTNALQHSEQRAFDPGTGNVVRLTSPNGLVTSYGYDAWGRPASESFNQHGISRWTQQQRSWCADSPGSCRTGEVFLVQATSAGGGASSEYFDALGRPVRVARKIGSGAWVESRTEYDVAGRVARSSSPYFSTGAPQFWATRTYDAVGRRAQMTAPASQNAPSGCASRVAYAGLVTTAYDCANRPTTRETDPLGRLVRVTDALGGTTRYTYDPYDNLTTTTDPDNAVTTLKYDRRGRKIEMTDADMGRWTYTYNALGEVISQKSARGKVVDMSYDLLGRMVRRTQSDDVATWTWDTAWKGALTQVSDDDYRKTLTYHPHGALASEEVVIFTRSPRTTRFTYDALGRPAQTLYHTGLAVENRYNAHGAANCVAKVGAGCYWEALDWDVWGELSLTRLGNGVETYRSRDAATGTLDALLAGRNGGTEVLSLNHSWSATGALLAREDHTQGGLREDFQYDALDRVSAGTLTGSFGSAASAALTYSPSGNIQAKSGAAYIYGTRPHAATQAGSATISYDADGNMTTGGGASGSRSISWTAFGQPWRIDDGAAFVQFHYSPEGRRVYQSASSPQLGARTTYYFNGLHEEHKAGSVTHQKHHIVTPEGLAAIETWNGSTFVKLEYLHKDHLGSVTAVTNSTGQVVERMAFDVFGKRRGITGQGAAATAFLTARGFTGHEMLDDVGLIHMNGRVYDPQLGRVISADPLISEPSSTQGMNRYAYVGNNPGSFTDPSGFSRWHSVWKRIEKIHRQTSPSQHVAEGRIHYMQKSDKYRAFTDVMSIVGTYYLGPYIAGAHTAFVSYSKGASLKDALHAGGIACGVGYALSFVNSDAFIAEYGYTGSTIASGVVGGVANYRSGGQFQDGFWSTFAVAGLANLSRYMRGEMVEQSKLDDHNKSGKSAGFEGDGFKLGGGRYNRWAHTQKPSPLGGFQGGKGQFFGMSYEPGSVLDLTVEAYAGPHDYLNSWYWYDSVGNIVADPMFGTTFGEVLNGMNVFAATPLVAATIYERYYMRAGLQQGSQW